MDEKLPSWVDKRAHPLFHLYQVPVRPNEKDCWRYGWDSSQEGLTPTQIVWIDGWPICVYCGHRAFPIQDYLRHARNIFYPPTTKDYDVTGYCCVCTKACDEVVVKGKITALEKKHAEALMLLKKKLPKPDLSILVTRIHESLVRKVNHDFLRLSDIENMKI